MCPVTYFGHEYQMPVATSTVPACQWVKFKLFPLWKKHHMDTYEYYDVNRFVQMDFLKICREVVKT